MAKYPFAEQARAVLEANGVSVNPDGSTAMKTQEPPVVVAPQPTQVFVDPINSTPTPPPAGEPKKQEETVDKDKLLALQREELDRLRSEVEKYSSQPQPQTKSTREAELERDLAELRGQLKAQSDKEAADEFRSVLEKQGFDSENLDDDVLLEIRDTFVKPMANKLMSLEERLAKAEDHYRDPTPQERLDKVKADTQAKIIAEVPDFDTVFKSASFQEKLRGKDNRFPFKASYGHALQEALENGNAEFIVNEVKAFVNGITPDLTAVADVSATTGTGTRTTTAKSEGSKYSFTDEEAVQMLRSFQRGDINRQQYRSYREQLEQRKYSS